MSKIETLTDEHIATAKQVIIDFDAVHPDVIRSAFWIRIHGTIGKAPVWHFVVAVSKPSLWYDHPVLGNPRISAGAIIEGVEDRNNLLVTQVVETIDIEPQIVEQHRISKHVLIDAYVYRAQTE
jgi:hypothetical protein